MTSTSPMPESPAITDEVPDFTDFADDRFVPTHVQTLIDRRAALREDLQEIRSEVRRRLGQAGDLQGRPNARRAATSLARLGFGGETSATVGDDGTNAVLQIWDFSDLKSQFDQAEDELEQIADRLLTMFVVWLDKYAPRPAAGFWTFTRTKGIPAAIILDISEDIRACLANRFEFTRPGIVFDAGQIRREYPTIAGEIDALLAENKGRLWFAAVGKTDDEE